MNEWQPIETCPENTWILLWADWDEPPIRLSKFHWIKNTEWETVSESSGKSGRRQIRQERITDEREWENGAGTYWMPLPEPPK